MTRRYTNARLPLPIVRQSVVNLFQCNFSDGYIRVFE